MKTITLDDEAYEVLRGLKVGPGDSFSNVVKRHFGHAGSLDESAGGWSDMTDKEEDALRRSMVEGFGTTLKAARRARR